MRRGSGAALDDILLSSVQQILYHWNVQETPAARHLNCGFSLTTKSAMDLEQDWQTFLTRK
jgi:hypothetical protein